MVSMHSEIKKEIKSVYLLRFPKRVDFPNHIPAHIYFQELGYDSLALRAFQFRFEKDFNPLPLEEINTLIENLIVSCLVGNHNFIWEDETK